MTGGLLRPLPSVAGTLTRRGVPIRGPSSTYDCQTCGACCGAVPPAADAYVRLFQIDLDRLRGTELPILRDEYHWTDWTEEILQLGIKLTGEGKRVCVAFDGEVGGACGCGIYERRPEACRKFEVGSQLCLEARRGAGLPVGDE